MFGTLIVRLKAWGKDAAAAIRAKLVAAVKAILPVTPAVGCASAIIADSGIVTSFGTRYREIGDHPHAPVFSLYTFFAQRRP